MSHAIARQISQGNHQEEMINTWNMSHMIIEQLHRSMHKRKSVYKINKRKTYMNIKKNQIVRLVAGPKQNHQSTRVTKLIKQNSLQHKRANTTMKAWPRPLTQAKMGKAKWHHVERWYEPGTSHAYITYIYIEWHRTRINEIE